MRLRSGEVISSGFFMKVCFDTAEPELKLRVKIPLIPKREITLNPEPEVSIDFGGIQHSSMVRIIPEQDNDKIMMRSAGLELQPSMELFEDFD